MSVRHDDPVPGSTDQAAQISDNSGIVRFSRGPSTEGSCHDGGRAAMTGQDGKSSGPGRPADEDASLEVRLKSLDAGLKRATNQTEAEIRRESTSADSSGIGQAMRLSTEFVAGIIVGGGLGWAVDKWLGTAPFGMIVLLMLGFGAGVMNVVRAAGLMKSRTDDKSSAQN
ncbi:AtpZ/AtpI family protein [Bosea sp. FBZP-16]|uniref:AtpZ/AtpI family protein n=1 Tax=Bosea sp. FBZP-16 TaxID=2065382 RepID=UPI0020BE48DA|nr:AtpZ/AtpI family protein [Bosea sp. FBZP-16]